LTIRILRLLMAATIACSAAPASAQTMYRCGSTFQDHPCGGGQASQAIGTLSRPDAARTSTASPRLSAECSQRGTAAQKIKWMREAGRTQQEQVAAAGGKGQDLIADVYRRQGTSAQVRSAIEEDCRAEEERNAQMAALLASASRPKGANGSEGASNDARNNDTVATAPGVASPARDSAADNKKAACQQLDSQLSEIRTRQRAGGSLQAMEALRQQDAATSNRRRAAGC
jgi:hypothetical protein